MSGFAEYPIFVAMKFLTFLLLVISMAAAFIPCCEFDECEEEINASQQSRREQATSCSPLSICPGCSTAIVLTKPLELPALVISQTKRRLLETPSIPPLYFSSFWQPPKPELGS